MSWVFEQNTEKYQKHCKVGLKNTKYNIMWVPKTHKTQLRVFIKTLLISVQLCNYYAVQYNTMLIPNLTCSVIAKIISGVPDMADLPHSAGHFEPMSDFFPSWWLVNISGHSCFPCRAFYVYWALLDKMSGKVWALCRTSAEVCRTCPAYFAITACYWEVINA